MLEKSCTEQDLCRVQHRFSRRQVREITKWGDTQLKIHLARLVELSRILARAPRPSPAAIERALANNGARAQVLECDSGPHTRPSAMPAEDTRRPEGSRHSPRGRSISTPPDAFEPPVAYHFEAEAGGFYRAR